MSPNLLARRILRFIFTDLKIISNSN